MEIGPLPLSHDMCGRFTLKTPVANWLADLFPEWKSDALDDLLEPLPPLVKEPRYNIAPTQPIVTARFDENGKLTVEAMRWGLVPFWADSLSVGYSMINARSESLADKPSFKPSLAEKRCVILADGYYEWKKSASKEKIPNWIHRPTESVFAMAGLWASNRKVPEASQIDKSIHTVTIITAEANEDTRSVHDRMPVIYTDSLSVHNWLDPHWNGKEHIPHLLQMLQPSPSGTLELRAVPTRVNNVRNQGPELIDAKE